MPTFSGSITTTGKSEAIRLDKALFRAHPEFRQRAKVRAQVIGPGHLLVALADEPGQGQEDDIERDPVVSAYLAFLERDMLAHPEHITPFSEDELARIRRLTDGVEVNDDDTIPDDVTL
ncbi:MAG TPA: type II toxin-antitoxin system PrlF family antitoxin [Acetobacteraceae bacterium]|nr:type II toxin-antitoxin system PrlF family antitoxin [Acetobacteraceae bacterium]